MTDSRLSSWSRAGLVALAAGMVFAAGCEPADNAGRAVQDASLKLHTLALGGTNPMPSASHRTKTYNEIVSLVSSHGNASRPGTAAAANLLLARAQEGLASVQAEEVSELEREFLLKTTAARGHLSRYLSQQSLASALESHDPQPQYRQLDAQKRSKEQEVAQASAHHLSLESTIAELERRAEQASAGARAEREREAALRQQAVNAGAVEQADLIARATEHRRAADGFDRQAAELKAEAARRAPEAAEAQAIIERMRGQLREIENTRNNAQQYARMGATQATEARSEAMTAAEQIRNLVADMTTLRGQIDPTAEKADGLFDKAIRAAQGAERVQNVDAETRSQAKLTAAIAQQGRAALMLTRARGLSTHAALLDSLAGAEPALPEAGSYRSRAAEAAKAAKELMEKANEAIRASGSGFESAGGRGDAGERLKLVKTELDKLSEMLDAVIEGRTPVVAAAPTRPTRPERAARAPSADPGDFAAIEREIRETLQEMLDAGNRDLEEGLSYLIIDQPAMKALMDAQISLNKACVEKFGRPMQEIMEDQADAMGGMGGNMASMNPMGGDSAADFEITVVSPTAALVVPRGMAGMGGMEALKQNDGWRFKVNLPPMVTPMLGMITKVFEDLAADVRSGAIASEDQLMPAMMEKMMRQMPGGG